MSLGGWGWAFRVYRLNSREAARRPLPFDTLKRAKRCRPKKKKKLVTQMRFDRAFSSDGASVQILNNNDKYSAMEYYLRNY